MRFSGLRLILVPVLIAGVAWAADPVVTPSPAPVLNPTLSLEQALASVEGVNVNVLLSRETTAQAFELTRLQRAGVLPIITGTLAQRRSQGVSTAGVAVSGTPASRFDAQVSANYALLDFNRLSALRGSKMGYEVAQANFSLAVQNALTTVAQTYFAHLRNSRRLAVFDAAIVRAKSLLDLARNQLAAGVATQIDVTRADSVLSLAEQSRLQQITVLYQSELLLKRLLDLDTGGELRLADFAVKRADPALYTFSDQKSAFERRADYLSAQKALEQVAIDVRTAGFQRMPSLFLSGQLGQASRYFDDSNKGDTWSTGVVISMPIFDGLRAGADKRVQLSRKRAQEFRIHNLELQISSEVRLAVQDATSRNAQMSVAEKSVRLAQEELRLAQQRYQQGVADNREVVEAYNRLAIADDNFVEAVYQYNLSRLELARAKGEVRTILAEKGP
jgi:outer membrane protein